MTVLHPDDPISAGFADPIKNGVFGYWTPGHDGELVTDANDLYSLVLDLRQPVIVTRTRETWGACRGGQIVFGSPIAMNLAYPVAAILPPCPPESLGDAEFCREHGLRFAYVAGAMANGIGSCDIVEAMSRAGMLGFFGAAGLSPDRVASAIDRLQSTLGDQPFGFNLIHSPNEPRLESEIAELYLRRGVRLVEASAYLDLTLPVVKYRVAGIRPGPDGQPFAPNRIIAKVSRVEVASKFMAPPPERFLRDLREQGFLNEEQVQLAKRLPMAQDVTGEADSGGHTDNRPAITLIPTLIALRDRLQRQYGYSRRIRIGAAGGIATPASAAAAFTLGASYILTGSINQACVESGSSDLVRQMLAQAEQADVTMAPAADMFEMGVKVQVLKRGTMFPMRAARLLEMYRLYPSLEALPASDRAWLENSIFRQSIEETWAQTRTYFQRRDPQQIAKAENDPKHKMALVFRWYLGQSSRWANQGLSERKVDFQIWCGPAMGAFNEWTKGSYLERPENRRVATVAQNLLYGAAWMLRVRALQQQGVRLSDEWLTARPMEPADLQRLLHGEVANR